MQGQSNKLRQFLRKVPGRSKFGIYRFLPVFFVLGAALEFSMIHWQVGEVNFYKTFKQRQVQEYVDELLRREREGVQIPFKQN